jgi:trans-aconitate methyltransferase
MDRKEVESFYDGYAEHQEQLGVNLRHREIMYRLKQAGLQPHHVALEVGCGIGTLTGLLAKHLKRGHVVACDISSTSIEVARQRLAAQTHVDFVHTDMHDFASNYTFDWFIFPDVLEHIPQHQHARLFQHLSPMAQKHARIAIHIPHPATLEMHREQSPQNLQVIDQSLDIAQLIADVQRAGYRLLFAQSYDLWEKPYDYMWLLFESNQPLATAANKGLKGAVVRRLKHLLTQL